MLSQGKHFRLVLLAVLCGYGKLVLSAATSCSDLPEPSAVNFIGIGYNILEGNPEGGDASQGGVDPGLLVGRKVLHLTHDECRTSNDNVYLIPDETQFVHRSSKVITKETTTFYGTKSYAKKLSAQVSASAEVDAIFASVQFAASSRYQSIEKETKDSGYVYFSEQTTTNRGHIRYMVDLAEAQQFKLSSEFAAAACKLSHTFEESSYVQFIDNWGTHVVTEADVGIREGTDYRADRSSFVKLASTETSNSVSVGGSYKIASASLSVNMDTFNEDAASEKNFGSKYSSYTIGSENLNEPISIDLIGMHEVLKRDYWTNIAEYAGCSDDFPFEQVGNNLLRALKGYAAAKNIRNSTDPIVKIPLVWPDGRYGLPEPVNPDSKGRSGCPNTDYLKWEEGILYQDASPDGYSTGSKDNHLSNYIGRSSSAPNNGNNVRTYYCMKRTEKASSGIDWQWQPGQYCIFQFGDYRKGTGDMFHYQENDCPEGFSPGGIKWDDADSDNNNNNGNDREGTLPKGLYDFNTQMFYCCREDGNTEHEIFLPTDNPFILLRRGRYCQKVANMTVEEEYIEWDTEATNNENEQTGLLPSEGVLPHNIIKIFYCYYSPKEVEKKETGIGKDFDKEDEDEARKEALLLLDLLEMLENDE